MDVDDAHKDIWYLAIGSMMLPQSCELRDFFPKESKGAELLDYRMNFFSSAGYAEAVRSPGKSMHGVLHLVTVDQMAELDKIEMGYIRESGKARAYDNPDKLIDVTVYCRSESARNSSDDSDDLPPTQRYLEILITGAKHYKLDEGYIQFLENHPYQPRSFPHEFESIGNIPNSSIHYEEVPKNNDCEGDAGKIYFTLNGKMLEYTQPKNSMSYKVMKNMYDKHGPHLEIIASRISFDTKYGTPSTLDEFTREHSAYIENEYHKYMEKTGQLHLEIIGSYAQNWID